MNEPRKGDIVTLIGLTKHGKNRIREQGTQWRVVDVGPCPAWMAQECTSGRALHLESLRLDGKGTPHWRLLPTTGNEHFSRSLTWRCSDCGILSQNRQCPQCWSMDQFIPWRE